MIPMFLFFLLSFLFFSPSRLLLVFFSLLIWHHELGLGLFTGITDSGTSVFVVLVVCVCACYLHIYKHYDLSRFFVYMHSIKD